jgi:hypothetical protein
MTEDNNCARPDPKRLGAEHRFMVRPRRHGKKQDHYGYKDNNDDKATFSKHVEVLRLI